MLYASVTKIMEHKCLVYLKSVKQWCSTQTCLQETEAGQCCLPWQVVCFNSQICNEVKSHFIRQLSSTSQIQRVVHKLGTIYNMYPVKVCFQLCYQQVPVKFIIVYSVKALKNKCNILVSCNCIRSAPHTKHTLAQLSILSMVYMLSHFNSHFNSPIYLRQKN